MKRDTILLCAVVSAVSAFGGMWLDATATLAAPMERVTLDTPEALRGGQADIKHFFKSLGYTGEFTVMSATRDESLNRRYYRVRVGVENITKVRQQLAKAWVWGRYNREVYDNNVSSRIPKSLNIPAWWRNLDTADSSRMMLDHGGYPQWYMVFSTSGEICLMWTGRAI